MADKYFINEKGRVEEHIQGTGEQKQIKFPLCLAIKYEDNVPMECPDFLLNTSRGRVFVRTDNPIAEGSNVVLHFYIPPNAKLLEEFKGKVLPEGVVNGRRGFYIKIKDFTHRRLHRLEDYLEEKRRLVDEKA